MIFTTQHFLSHKKNSLITQYIYQNYDSTLTLFKP
jgi:hypothetical protein